MEAPARARLRFSRAFRERLDADVAQLVERVLGKDEVTGSIPVIGSSPASRAGSARRGAPRVPVAVAVAAAPEAAFREQRQGPPPRRGGSNSVVECQPSKLNVAGSNPVSRSKLGNERRG